MAYNYRDKYPSNFHILKLEDFLKEKKWSLIPILSKINIPWDESLLYPSFNGKDLSESIKPWGTLVKATTEANIKTAKELTYEDKEFIWKECRLMLKTFYPNELF